MPHLAESLRHTSLTDLELVGAQNGCLGNLSALRPAQAEIALGAENSTVKAWDPPPTGGGNIQVLNGGLDMRRNTLPIKLRV